CLAHRPLAPEGGGFPGPFPRVWDSTGTAAAPSTTRRPPVLNRLTPCRARGAAAARPWSPYQRADAAPPPPLFRGSTLSGGGWMMSKSVPRLLILETSSQAGQVAVAEGERLLGVRSLDEARRHARDLAPAFGDLLAAQGWRPRDLDGVIVSRGPGSYTGLRVGIMSAKALAYATGCALLAVDTFAAIAAQAPPEALTLHVLADAQQDQLYVQPFRRAGAGADFVALSPLTI